MQKIEKLFFKKRIVFVLHSNVYKPNITEQELFFCKVFKCGESYEAPDEESIKMIASKIGKERLEARLSNPQLTLFVAYERASNLPVGFCWSITTSRVGVWHDKFYIGPGCTYVFNAHVLKDYRKRGIYKLLKAFQLNHLFLVEKVEKVITLVEQSNIPSIRAQERFGFKRASDNYLVKFFGRNILSIFVGEFKGWHCVVGKTKSHNI